MQQDDIKHGECWDPELEYGSYTKDTVNRSGGGVGLFQSTHIQVGCSACATRKATWHTPAVFSATWLATTAPKLLIPCAVPSVDGSAEKVLLMEPYIHLPRHP